MIDKFSVCPKEISVPILLEVLSIASSLLFNHFSFFRSNSNIPEGVIAPSEILSLS